MTKIKICGLKNNEDAEFASSIGVDYVGMIFVENVRRKVTLSEAASISNTIKNTIDAPELVGLFADQPIEVVKKIAKDFSLDYVQLCGQENKEYLNNLDIPFIKQIKLKKDIIFGKVFEEIEFVKSRNGMISVDTYKKGYYGGSGELINLSLAQKIIDKHDVFLAGGLNLKNITNILDTMNPWAVDISTGVETNEKKDKYKIEKFVNSVREHKN